MKTLHEAAADYCAAKESDRVLRLGMRGCEYERGPEMGLYDLAEVDEVSACWRGKWHMDSDGEQVWDVGEWCPACLHNRQIIEQSRAIRSSFGGLASAMMAAYRREEGS